eukprot:1888694-Pleurochrysis_carterae.AAC.1
MRSRPVPEASRRLGRKRLSRGPYTCTAPIDVGRNQPSTVTFASSVVELELTAKLSGLRGVEIVPDVAPRRTCARRKNSGRRGKESEGGHKACGCVGGALGVSP